MAAKEKMQFFVGVTDNRWFEFLAERKPDEVNFWKPGGGRFRAVPPGAPFLFKLHSPLNCIAGGGYFVRYDSLPVSIAWEAFGDKNGAADLFTLANMIRRHRRDAAIDPEIGCVVLADPFFLPESEWIPEPSDWKSNIVSGRTYDTSNPVGAALWEQVAGRRQRLRIISQNDDLYSLASEESQRYGSEFSARARLGQGAFRVCVTSAYHHRCAITGERTLPVLQAAHIKPFGQGGPHSVQNGLLLRSDLHILFDRGYLTVTPNMEVKISGRIREEFENGRDYYALQGRPLVQLPANGPERPSPEFLDWHNRELFVA